MNRFLCKECKKRFGVDHGAKKELLWIRHMDGAAFRSLGNETRLSGSQVYTRVMSELDTLPDNTDITRKYCEGYSGILNVDGKYVKVKGHAKKIPFVYGIDFLKHDIPIGVLASSESSETFLQLFCELKSMDYPLKVVVCDNVSSLKQALLQHFPDARIQLCHTHYLENVRQAIRFRTDPTYRHFFHSLVKHVFHDPQNESERNMGLAHVRETHVKDNLLLQTIMFDLEQKKETLFQYESIPHCPKTNNMIESSNSHLQGRLKTIKGFQSFDSAKRWLNAWMLRRRTKPFTDCEPPFTHLNGKTSLSVVTKKDGPRPPFIS